MDVLQQVAQLDLTEDQWGSVNRLKGLVELLQASHQNVQSPTLILDLSLIQTFDYYTGIVFEVVSATGQRVLGQGGRYDQLLGLYHPKGETQPGIGFVLNIEELHQILLPTGRLPAHTPPSDWLIVPASSEAYAAAFAYAETIRSSAHLVRVEVELGERSTPEAIHDYALLRKIQQIVWVDAAGTAKVEVLYA